MSRLFANARRSENTEAFDGYTSDFVCMVQSSQFMESSNFGSTSEKRVISTPPDATIPEHRILEILGEKHLVGGVTIDECQGLVIRKVYWTRKVLNQFEVLSPATLLSDLDNGSVEYGQAVYFSNNSDPARSVVSDKWLVYLKESSQHQEGVLLSDSQNDVLFRVRKPRVDVDRFCTVECDRISWPALCSVTLRGAYSAETDSYTTETLQVKILVLDYFTAHDQNSKAEQGFAQGDLMAVIAVQGIKPDDTLATGGVTYTVLSVETQLDAKLIHLRKC